MDINLKEFRFAYFSDQYDLTCRFYREKLELDLLFSWERDEHDRGSVFRAGQGRIEILHLPKDSEERTNAGLDYNTPNGSFMVIEVQDVDTLYEKYINNNIDFKQHLTNQSWGHRSFSIIDPNSVILFMWESIHV